MPQLMGDHSLVGRARELGEIEQFLSRTRDGGPTLLLTGEPGVGKTVLLDASATRAAATGLRVIRGGGIEYESNVSFAGLHQLVDQVGDDLRRLPPPSRRALDVALGVGAGPAPDRLAVLRATLALFRGAAMETPLVLVIDDMHWLDRASAAVIGFVGRRIAGSQVSILGAMRPSAGGFFERTGWSELAVLPLDDQSATEMLSRRFAQLSPRVLRTVVHEAQGNPLALGSC